MHRARPLRNSGWERDRICCFWNTYQDARDDGGDGAVFGGAHLLSQRVSAYSMHLVLARSLDN